MSPDLLTVDVGNSHTTIGLMRGEQLMDTWRLSTRVARTEDELWVFLRNFLDGGVAGDAKVIGAGIASVVPEMTALIRRTISKRLGLQPVVITHGLVKSLKIEYDPPSGIGPDRLCGAVAAHRMYGAPVIVADLGTATVLDVVDKDAVYRGGVIAPGVATAAEALHKAAALLPTVDLKFPATVIGQSTESAMQSGILFGALELIDGLATRIQETLGYPAPVVATGGFASLLKSQSRTIRHIEPDLVLHGIRLIVRDIS